MHKQESRFFWAGGATLKTFSRIMTALTSWGQAAARGFDIRDVFVFGGLGMLGYGLYLFRPWLAFAVCGVLLIAIGYLMRGKS